jgi:hypothetical protein
LIQKVGHRLRFLWWTFAEAIGNFLNEAAFRLLICWRVITGRVPQRIEHRRWDPSEEAPIVVNVHDFGTNTLLFSTLIWPVSDLEAPTPAHAEAHQLARAEAVMRAITAGATEQRWSLLYEVEERLLWDWQREVWVTRDGHAFEYPKDEGS